MKKLAALAVFGVVALIVAAVVFNAVAAAIAGPIVKGALSAESIDRTAHPKPDWARNDIIDVEFHSSDGIRLEGWWLPAEGAGPHPAVIVAHGLSGHKRGMLDVVGPTFHEAGYGVLVFDQRNHGTSADGQESLITMGAGESLDILAALGYIRDNAATLGADADRIILYGESMGAVATLHAARINPEGIVGVVADSAFEGAVQRASEDSGIPSFLVKPGFKKVGKELGLDMIAVDSPTAVTEIVAPIMVVHCTDDTLTPIAAYHAIVAAGGSKLTTWAEPCPLQAPDIDNHHVQAYLQPGYNEQLLAFMDAAVQ